MTPVLTSVQFIRSHNLIVHSPLPAFAPLAAVTGHLGLKPVVQKTWTIRAATPDDLVAIRRLYPVQSERGKARDLIADFAANSSCWVVTQDESVIAFGIFDHEFYGHGMVWLIVVADRWRRRGAATELIRYFESICRSDRTFISTNESNTRMQALLAKLAYERSGLIHNLDPRRS